MYICKLGFLSDVRVGGCLFEAERELGVGVGVIPSLPFTKLS